MTNILTVLQNIHITPNSPDYYDMTQQLIKEALQNPELTTRQAMSLAARAPRTPKQIAASIANGKNCQKGMGGRKKGSKNKKGKVTK